MKFIKHIILLFIINVNVCYSYDVIILYNSEDTILIIDEESSIDNSIIKDSVSNSYISYYNVDNQENSFNIYGIVNNDNNINSISLPIYNNINFIKKDTIKSIPTYYLESAANYYSVSFSSGIVGATTGGITAGLTSGYNRFVETGIIDLGTTIRSTAIMTTSSLIGVQAGSYTMDLIVSPIISNFAISSMLSTSAGGVASGLLYAVGSYFTGAIDRHEMRTIAIKSSVGTTASVGVSTILGVGAGASAFSLGGLIVPTIISMSVVYLMDKMYKVFDKQEKIDRINGLLIEISK